MNTLYENVKLVFLKVCASHSRVSPPVQWCTTAVLMFVSNWFGSFADAALAQPP